MAYKALYRTYRPTNFEDMAGQKFIIKTLENAVNQDKIAHAYLFCGPRGTGKTSVAKIFAKAVNCDAELKPCGVCDSCKSAVVGNHPDIVEIDAASNNGVEEVRNLIDKVKYAPIKGKYKVYIIDEVHMMSQGAYNALLKTIEEPPAHVIFIFATTEPYKVIPTIISRCQRFDFAKISNKDIEDRLKIVTSSESIAYEAGVLENIAILADGGMRDALSILDQCYAYAPDMIGLNHVFEIYGIMTSEEKIELFKFVKNGDTTALMNKIEMIDQRGIDIKRLTSELIELLKEMVIYNYTSDERLLKVMLLDQVQKLSNMYSSKEALKMIDILMDGFEKYRYATSVLAYLEISLLKMMENVSRETNISQQKVVIQSKEEKSEIVAERENSAAFEIPIKKEVELPVPDENDMEVAEVKHQEDEEAESSTIMNAVDVENMEDILDGVDEVTNQLVEKKEMKTLEDEMILRLLVSANKNEKEEDREQMKGIHQYKLDIDHAKYANLLAPNEIVASGNQFLVVCTNSIALANELNDLQNNDELLPFISLLFQKKKRVFAITNIQYERVVEDFRIKHRTNSLPEPIVFDEIVEEVKEEKDEKMEKLNILFGDNIEIKENE